MERILIVARLRRPGVEQEIAERFGASDRTELPRLAGTLSRSLFSFHGLYFHFSEVKDTAKQAIDRIRDHPDFISLSQSLRPFVEAYDPETWRAPEDAMAREFYRWEA
mgnify:CR=1 FL=1